jgi:hypothetical protein
VQIVDIVGADFPLDGRHALGVTKGKDAMQVGKLLGLQFLGEQNGQTVFAETAKRSTELTPKARRRRGRRCPNSRKSCRSGCTGGH